MALVKYLEQEILRHFIELPAYISMIFVLSQLQHFFDQ